MEWDEPERRGGADRRRFPRLRNQAERKPRPYYFRSFDDRRQEEERRNVQRLWLLLNN